MREDRYMYIFAILKPISLAGDLAKRSRFEGKKLALSISRLAIPGRWC
jgi:hypothetical protein